MYVRCPNSAGQDEQTYKDLIKTRVRSETMSTATSFMSGHKNFNGDPCTPPSEYQEPDTMSIGMSSTDCYTDRQGDLSEMSDQLSVLSPTLKPKIAVQDMDDLFSERKLWELWHTNKKDAQKILEASLCSIKKNEDANHTQGVHPPTLEGSLSPKMEWLRNHTHEVNGELKNTSRHKVEGDFRWSLRNTCQDEKGRYRSSSPSIRQYGATYQSSSRSLRRSSSRMSRTSESPFRTFNPAEDPFKHKTFMGESVTKPSADVVKIMEWCCNKKAEYGIVETSPSVEDQNIFDDCYSADECLKRYYLEVQSDGSDKKEKIHQQFDRRFWQLWNMNRNQSHNLWEDSLCRNKKAEDTRHLPGMHPTETNLTPRMEWLREHRFEVNSELKHTPRRKVETHFQESLRSEAPTRRCRSSSPFVHSTPRTSFGFQARSLSRTRPGSRAKCP